MTTTSATRILVIANRTCPCPGLHDEIAGAAEDDATEVLVVAPALNGKVRHWASDTDEALNEAKDRLEATVAELLARGVTAKGAIGDSDPYVAIDDALAAFAADQVIVSTHPPSHSNWLEQDLLMRIEDELSVPVVHVVSRYGLDA